MVDEPLLKRLLAAKEFRARAAAVRVLQHWFDRVDGAMAMLARMANDLAASENGVVVFASSSGKQLSEENDAWGNGAFTEIVLEALSSRADTDKNGRISVSELTGYLTRHVPGLTNGKS